MICSLCSGTGELDKYKRPDNEDKIELAKFAQELIEKGLSLRQIAKLINFKHPYSVTDLINRHYIIRRRTDV